MIDEPNRRQTISTIKPKTGFYVSKGSSIEKETPSFIYQNQVDGKWYVKTFLRIGGYSHEKVDPHLFENIREVSEQEINKLIVDSKNSQTELANKVCFLKGSLEELTDARRTDRDEPGTDPAFEILSHSPIQNP